MFWAEIWKISELYFWKSSFFGGENFSIFEYVSFHNVTLRRFFYCCAPNSHFRHNVRKHTFWRAPNEYSNQPAHPWSLIRVFVVRMKTLCILRCPKCDQWSFRSVCGMRRLIWILPVAHFRSYILSRCDGSFNFVYTLLYHYYYYHC